MLEQTTDRGVPLDVLESIEAADGAPGTGEDRSPGGAATGSSDPALRARYRAYRRQQATALLTLLPREAIRPLHREALAWSTDGGYSHDPGQPLETLVEYCARILPLPPFDVWREDLRRNPVAHLEAAVEPTGPGGRTADPVTLAARIVEGAGDTWDAGLRVFSDEEVWRGYIVFRSRTGQRRARTAHVFREEGPEAVRERFLEMAPATLAAFLRSSLP